MAYLSKVLQQDLFQGHDCKDLFHPWNSSCYHGSLQMTMSSFRGCFCFFTITYLVQYLVFRIKKKKKINRLQMLISFVRSLSFGVTYISAFVLLNCFFRRLMGKLTLECVGFVVPFLAGSSIFFQSRERRDITATSYITMAFETVYKKLIVNNVILRSRRFETILFMVINAFMMYFLRKQQELNGKCDNFWFLMPSPLKSEEHQENIFPKNSKKICPHENSCTNEIMKDTAKYAFMGLIMSGIRFIVSKLMSPNKTNESFFQGKHFQIPLFISSYIFIYKALSCYLCKRRGKDSLKQTFFCGLLSGISYRFNSSLTLLFTALTVLFKIIGKQIKDNYKVPNLPYIELCFLFCNVFLLYTSVFDDKAFPTSFYKIISLATENKGMVIIKAMRDVIESKKN